MRLKTVKRKFRRTKPLDRTRQRLVENIIDGCYEDIIKTAEKLGGLTEKGAKRYAGKAVEILIEAGKMKDAEQIALEFNLH
ncbi:hypothetical protein JXB01_04490, partial [Candidatus Micrarchaeota archaeon]|nr:hypothetical protein [Candidatus Micrarchaeota archaeon]